MANLIKFHLFAVYVHQNSAGKSSVSRGGGNNGTTTPTSTTSPLFSTPSPDGGRPGKSEEYIEIFFSFENLAVTTPTS